MIYVFRAGMTGLALMFALTPPAGASTTALTILARPRAECGLFGKIFRPKIDLGKTGRALTYPVKKAAVNGGKAAVGAATSYYIASKKPGVAAIIPHGK